MFINYAHRGASSYAPENTMSSFKKGLELGANGIELDLQRTKDGKIVIFHDEYIDKKSNAEGKISDYTYNELKEFDFGSWFSEEFKGESIVLFDDFAEEFLKLKNITFAIELKEAGFESEALSIIKKYSDAENIYISSFIYEALKEVRAIDDNIKISWLIREKIDKENIKKLLEIKGNQICPKATNVSAEDIDLANNSGLGVRLWGVSTEEIMNEVYKFNTEGMTVNFPDKLNKLLSGR